MQNHLYKLPYTFNDRVVFSSRGQIKAGKARLEGNGEVCEQLKTLLVHFGLGFEIMPGTGAKDLTPEEKPFQQEQSADTAGG